MRNRSLECVEAIVERQKRVPAKLHDDGFLFHRQNLRSGNGGNGAAICGAGALPPLGDRLRADAMPASQRPQALLTRLYARRTTSVVVALRCNTCPSVPPSLSQKSMHHHMPRLNT